jgi:hypothetical protein
MHVKELVACLLGVKQTFPTDKGYVPTLFLYQKIKQLRQTNNSNFKEAQVLDG